jgi:hypothetical protein
MGSNSAIVVLVNNLEKRMPIEVNKLWKCYQYKIARTFCCYISAP